MSYADLPSARGTQLDNTKEYYAGRCKKAREMASAAHDQTIAKIHEELADHYEALAKGTRPVQLRAVQG